MGDTILKDCGRYRLVDTRGTHYTGSYQILENVLNRDFKWETCGDYTNKKDAIKAFNALKKSMKIIEEIKEDIENLGYSEIQSGVYLCTRDRIICDSDPDMKDDYGTYEFWVHNDSNDYLEGFDSIEEALKILD